MKKIKDEIIKNFENLTKNLENIFKEDMELKLNMNNDKKWQIKIQGVMLMNNFEFLL